MTLDPIYVAWLLDYIHAYEHAPYIWVAETLATVPFYWTLWIDENANTHGIELRERYAQNTGNEKPVGMQATLLEVMIATAIWLEESCFYDRAFDGAFRWFWVEFQNIGFADCMTQEDVYAIAERFLSRTYSSDGSGSFTGPLFEPKEDIRNTPFMNQMKIWYVRNFM